MKQNQLNKLFTKLSAEEQAALMFNAIARVDKQEIDVILASLPKHAYISPDADYRNRLILLQTLVSNYGIEYWKLRAAIGQAKEIARQGYVEIEMTISKLLAKAVALEIAIAEACNQMKLDVEVVKSIIDSLGLGGLPKNLPPANTDLVDSYVEILIGKVDVYRVM
jgi:hypothetical protein